jgi:hypothetical protein
LSNKNFDFLGTDLFTKTAPAHNNVTKRNFIDGEKTPLLFFMFDPGGAGLPFDEKPQGASYILAFQGLSLALVIVNLKGGKGHVYV